MNKSIKYLLFIILFWGCNANTGKQFDGYILTGKTSGINDNSVIYLFDELTEQILDSTIIIKNEFEFRGKLDNPPRSVHLITRDKFQAAFLWMENSEMTFDASKGDFKNAIFKGSKIHEWADEELFSIIDTIGVIYPTVEDLAKRREICLEFVEKHSDNMLSAHILSVYAEDPNLSLGRIKDLYQNLSVENKNSIYGQRIKKSIETLGALDIEILIPDIGDDFVDFEMKDTSGFMRKLSESRGKVTLLEFWASWCGPCMAEMPNLKKTYNEHRQNGFEVFAVSLDKSEVRWKKAIEQLDLNWINASDLNGYTNAASIAYGVNAIPHNFLIDSTGKIIGRNLRGDKLDSELNKIFKQEAGQ